MAATFILVDGPFSDVDLEGDECAVWFVCPMDDEGNEDKVEHYRTYTEAVGRGRELARSRRLELIIDATRD